MTAIRLHEDDGNGGCLVCRQWAGGFDDDAVYVAEAFPCPTVRLRATVSVSTLATVMHREFWVDEKPHVDDAELAQTTDCSICWGVAFRIAAALPDPEHRRSER